MIESRADLASDLLNAFLLLCEMKNRWLAKTHNYPQVNTSPDEQYDIDEHLYTIEEFITDNIKLDANTENKAKSYIASVKQLKQDRATDEDLAKRKTESDILKADFGILTRQGQPEKRQEKDTLYCHICTGTYPQYVGENYSNICSQCARKFKETTRNNL